MGSDVTTTELVTLLRADVLTKNTGRGRKQKGNRWEEGRW